MNLDLKGKCAIVGGASQGIGYGIAHLLASEGARVAVTARREKDLRAAAEKMAQQPAPRSCRCRRIVDRRQIVSASSSRRRSVRRIDILVNNDGAPPLGELVRFDDVAWQKAIEQNFMYVARMCRGVLPFMQKAGAAFSHHRHFSHSADPPFWPVGCKLGAVIGYAKDAGARSRRHGINVNTICPGYIDTQRLEKVFSAGEQAGTPYAQRT